MTNTLYNAIICRVPKFKHQVEMEHRDEDEFKRLMYHRHQAVGVQLMLYTKMLRFRYPELIKSPFWNTIENTLCQSISG